MIDPITGAFVGGAAGAGLVNALRGNPPGGADISAQLTELSAAIRQLITTLGGMSEDHGGNAGLPFAYPPNPTKILTQLIVPAAVGVAERLPDLMIPPDMALIIKAQLTNFGLIYVGKTKTEAENPNVAYPLIFNEAVGYRILNANQIWICNTMAGEGANITVEQGG